MLSSARTHSAILLLRIALCALCCAAAPAVRAQAAPADRAPATRAQPAAGREPAPIAIVPIDSGSGDQAATVSGALEVSGGKAIIAASGSVTSGSKTTEVVLPHRGVLRVCASTTVKLAADTSVPAGETPGLLMAMDHGAVEMSFANLRNADILLTPNFRILIGGQGASEVKVRLGSEGDTCVDNSGANAPYVVVTSVFDSGLYRVQPGQRVMFQHGSLREVVDQEKEPCGCPPARRGQSERVSAGRERGTDAESTSARRKAAHCERSRSRSAGLQRRRSRAADRGDRSALRRAPAAAPANPPANPPATKKKPGFFGKVGQFFRAHLRRRVKRTGNREQGTGSTAIADVTSPARARWPGSRPAPC